MAQRKWKHQARFESWKGKMRVQCACGKSSPAFFGDDKEAQAKAWYLDHVGLKEQTPRRFSDEDDC
jgi:hypothetical protein